ncbi:MAG: 5-methyltetrahydropteroyltriglutamate--homocysteine S-methyltransferase [Betaproteobacteria bacterium RIFCSPLOWO2_02_FULL_65_24]|nr:MAG: 5-methyltetrahydropteroyltriglutamate--homocysteine S-methyltransferase [Betaproteobacteria bacterium RIFCSPLOWO2_02_FULL_65_24]
MTDKPPFRADHVGSLLRPKEVLQAREDLQAGRISAARLRAIEDEAIRTVVKMQEHIGLRGITDGELRRHAWHLDFYNQIHGIGKGDQTVPIHFENDSGDIDFRVDTTRVAGKLKLDHTIFAEDFLFLRSATTRTAKLTIPAPSVLHRRGGRELVDPGVYPDMELFWNDLSAVYAEQVQRLGALGCTYLQLDDTSFATLCDPSHRASMGELGADGEHIHETYIRLFNEAVKNRPAGMAICTHTCRGNYRSAWFASGGYDFIAEALFNQLDADGFFLEYDDERSGGFEPLRFLPKGKKVVLGLVTTKKGALEAKDALKRRIDQAARYAPLEQLCLSPQCGFSSTVEGNAITLEEQIAKLRLVVETAREVWG